MADSDDHPIDRHYAGFGIRFLAFVIDSLLVMVIISPLLSLLFGSVDVSNYDPTNAADFWALITSVKLQLTTELFVVGAVFVLFWISRGATPGKELLGCFIVDAETYAKAGAGQLTLRYLGYFPAMLVFFLGLIWVAFDARKQGWHDKLAGTVVIRSRPAEHDD